ncbi:MAG: MoaD/ThiS family protein [Eubacteriales bacterium]|nr:MoaD/ThiS family protein [Eubacteriales bacterium]
MIVFLRFVAFSSQKSNRITPFSLPDRSTMEGLLNAIQENWKETGTGTEDEQNSLRDQTIFASNGRMLLPDEPLTEGQQISVIGPILGG